jgi:calmodulin
MEEPEPTGYISYANFFTVAMRILASGGVKRATEQELFQAFLTLDTEKKGYLLPEELRTYLEGDGERFTPEEMVYTACRLIAEE